jgi:Holliday junction resolvase
MASTPESKVKKKVVAILKRHNVYHFFPAANGYGRSGIPDIICCWHGAFVAIECKAGGGRTTALQDREIARINDAGGTTVVLRDTDVGFLEKLLKNALLTGEAK